MKLTVCGIGVKNRETDQWAEENKQARNTHTHFSQFTHDKGSNKVQYRRDGLLINGAGSNG